MEDTNRHPLSDHDEFLAAITVQVVPRCVRDHADVLQVGTDLDRLVLEVTPPIVQEDVASWRLRITSGYDVASDEQVGPAVSIVIEEYGRHILAPLVCFQRRLSNGYEPPVALLQIDPARLAVSSPREHIDETVSIHIRLNERRAHKGLRVVHEGLPTKVVDLSGHPVLERDGRGHFLENGR